MSSKFALAVVSVLAFLAASILPSVVRQSQGSQNSGSITFSKCSGGLLCNACTVQGILVGDDDPTWGDIFGNLQHCEAMQCKSTAALAASYCEVDYGPWGQQGCLTGKSDDGVKCSPCTVWPCGTQPQAAGGQCDGCSCGNGPGAVLNPAINKTEHIPCI